MFFAKLFVPTLLLSATQGFKVMDNVLSAQDIRELEQSKICDGATKKSFYQVDSRILSKLPLEHSSDDSAVSLRARSIETTTHEHQDRHWGSGDIVQDSVAFVFLNTNPDAQFVHGDGHSVPVKAGTMVQFPGAVSHYTQVNSGNVQLVGPFHVNTLTPVGTFDDEGFINPPVNIPTDLALNLVLAFFALLGVIAVAVTALS